MSKSSIDLKLSITVLIAAKNEAVNIRRCITSVRNAERVIVVDSGSIDETAQISLEMGAEVVQFSYCGGYPKKRQWALDKLKIYTDWVLLLDADEVIPPELWHEIEDEFRKSGRADAYLITKGFHFFGHRFKFGGFSHAAVILFRPGTARFEHVLDEPADAMDMEVHERLAVKGLVGCLKTPLIHEDFKGLEAYIDRHNRYSTWEAKVRKRFMIEGSWGEETITPSLFGNVQERRRFIKKYIIRIPLEPLGWFIYHYFVRLGFLEGRPGLIASRIRAQYIFLVRAKLYEFMRESSTKY